MELQFPYGRGEMIWTPPAELEIERVDRPEPPPLADPLGAVDEALNSPLDAAPLEKLAAGARTATIVVTDATRPCPDNFLVARLAARLNVAGIPDERITLLVAIGMHRPSTAEEKLEKLGPDLLRRFVVLDSVATDPAMLVDYGLTPDGTPAFVDQRAAQADILIATGIVEPHQYAGYSGGWKSVAIGAAGAATITALHGMRFLEDPRVRLAQTSDNPFLDATRWIGEKAGLRFVLNVALNSEHRIIQVMAGHPESVHRRLAAWVGRRAVASIARAHDIVIGAAGHPKDSNLYQATRIPTYLCFGRRPVIREGGVILVPAACPEGAGQGPGERKFHEWLTTGGGPDAIIEKARREGYSAGGQRTVMVARAQKLARIAFIGAKDPDVVRECGFESFASLDEGVKWACDMTGARRLLAVPRALTTLPEVAE